MIVLIRTFIFGHFIVTGPLSAVYTGVAGFEPQ